VGINIILALGLNVIIGSIGQIHLGWAAYAGAGAYITAYLLKSVGTSFWFALPLSIAGGALFGFLTGLPALRVRGDFLAILSIAIVFVFEALMRYLPWYGGPMGIDDIPRPMLLGTRVSEVGCFLLVWFFAVIVILLTRFIGRSWVGLAWECVRLDEETTYTMGINTARYKLLAFIVGGAFAGLGGSLYTSFFRHICPHDFSFIPSLGIFTMVVVGGAGTILGPIVGAFVFTLLPEILRFAKDYINLVYGLALVLVIMYYPCGIFGKGSYLSKTFQLLCKRKAACLS
jgi:branched-chain amino acid transport system permease protein